MLMLGFSVSCLRAANRTLLSDRNLALLLSTTRVRSFLSKTRINPVLVAGTIVEARYVSRYVAIELR
ncbi:hypothetical protein WN51_09422 [Melipona quadrifasciata]|uniref:Uncharacterized protein n=1 Tax=Melipona quadrifasciata TaxID=166423 RepID=A0A0N0U2H5_9HYME|nr:hypothetical protein WN51_09422 [Melipona quadrifasciata]